MAACALQQNVRGKCTVAESSDIHRSGGGNSASPPPLRSPSEREREREREMIGWVASLLDFGLGEEHVLLHYGVILRLHVSAMQRKGERVRRHEDGARTLRSVSLRGSFGFLVVV